MAKREIYARLGVQLRNNRRCYRAEKIAMGAMGLYAWCVMDARAELPDADGKHEPGFVDEGAALTAWGGPEQVRSAQLEALCSVDLLERVDGGFVVVQYEEHNDTWKDVQTSRKAARKRKEKWKQSLPGEPENDVRTNAERVPERAGNGEVPISYSYSPTNLEDRKRDQGGESERGAPPWFHEAVAMLEQNAPDVHRGLGHVGERWMQYQGAIERGRPQTARAAAGWLTSTIRSERAQADRGKGRGADVTKQPYDPDAPWLRAASGDKP